MLSFDSQFCGEFFVSTEVFISNCQGSAPNLSLLTSNLRNLAPCTLNLSMPVKSADPSRQQRGARTETRNHKRRRTKNKEQTTTNYQLPTTKPTTIKGPDNPTSQLLPKMSSKCCSGTGKEGKTKEVLKDQQVKKKLCVTKLYAKDGV